MKFIFLLFLVAAVSARLPSRDSLARSEDSDFTDADCLLPHETDCQGLDLEDTYIAWRWYEVEHRCVQAVGHNSCTPTKNNFGSYKECRHTTRPVCPYLLQNRR
ncbi:uncharacterized protein LOC126884983 [Diabrotica virgifera virgifera]|uniref:Uncharacterized protein n=1 Tax=Diabrotica virgifera virgifera TaxID=50390 RepID=A0ABM5KAV9_DIAVI|nr:uncharacterized protein LOC126884983 [Diabrotica virgifera virgifera]